MTQLPNATVLDFKKHSNRLTTHSCEKGLCLDSSTWYSAAACYRLLGAGCTSHKYVYHIHHSAILVCYIVGYNKDILCYCIYKKHKIHIAKTVQYVCVGMRACTGV